MKTNTVWSLVVLFVIVIVSRFFYDVIYKNLSLLLLKKIHGKGISVCLFILETYLSFVIFLCFPHNIV